MQELLLELTNHVFTVSFPGFIDCVWIVPWLKFLMKMMMMNDDVGDNDDKSLMMVMVVMMVVPLPSIIC